LKLFPFSAAQDRSADRISSGALPLRFPECFPIHPGRCPRFRQCCVPEVNKIFRFHFGRVPPSQLWRRLPTDPVRVSPPIRVWPMKQLKQRQGCPLLPFPSLLSRFPLRSEEHTSELQSRENLVCRLLLEKKK